MAKTANDHGGFFNTDCVFRFNDINYIKVRKWVSRLDQ